MRHLKGDLEIRSVLLLTLKKQAVGNSAARELCEQLCELERKAIYSIIHYVMFPIYPLLHSSLQHTHYVFPRVETFFCFIH